MDFPRHDASLTLQHNDHKSVYDSASDWISENEMYAWRSDEAKDRAITTDSIWTLQWYPHTPIGFYSIAAPTLEDLLAWAAEIEKETARFGRVAI